MTAFIYTISRASTPTRGKHLLETLTNGREMAGHPAHWHVHLNDARHGEDIAEAALATRIIDSYEASPENLGQHIPTNEAIALALSGGYDYLVRVDDDCKFLTRGWLKKMVEASELLQDQFVISPTVKGLKYPPSISTIVEVEGVPFVFIEGPIGGICRLTPVKALKEHPYTSDVRSPMGIGDASGVAAWALASGLKPIYLRHVRVAHNTDKQEKEDPAYFDNHALFQILPYIPRWSPDGQR